MGYKTALDLSRADIRFIRENFNVVLERTVRELRGEACLALDEAPSPKQQIVCSRSFGERITDIIATERLLTPTQDTRDIVAAAQRALRRIWRDGVRYMKAGVMLSDFSGQEAQLVLFDDLPPGATVTH